MRDVQSERDYRNIPLERVGVEGLKYPIKVMDRTHGTQPTVGTVSLAVDLPEEFRGTHMSRFLEVLHFYKDYISLNNLEEILDELRNRLNASSAHIEIEFPYFLKKKAPVTGAESYMDYRCKFIATKNREFDFILEVNVPIQTLCPCSKEISDYGAHNQRAEVTIQIRMKKLVWIEELVEIAEESASSPLYALLKREDEKYVTEHAYDNPKFVEDVVRDVAMKLEANERIIWYYIMVKSFESIHHHNAYACLRRDKSQKKNSD